MKHVVTHDLGQEQAKRVADEAFASYKSRYAQYKPTASWTSDRKANISFSLKGMSMTGVVEVTATTIEMDLDVPFMLRPFKNVALNVIEEEIKKWIAKAKSGGI
jgi:hypothetical protein